MKKFISKLLALTSALVVTCAPTFAIHSMNNRTHDIFVKKLCGIMESFSKKIKGRYDDAALVNYIESWNKSNDDFDATNGFPVGGRGTATFSDAMQMCYKHVTTPGRLSKQPFNCRGLSLFVLQELRKQDITSILIQHIIQHDNDIHAAVVYALNDELFVCDFGRAMGLQVIKSCASSAYKNAYFAAIGCDDPKKFLSIPLTEYMEKSVASSPYGRILPTTMKIFDKDVYQIIPEEVHDKIACEILDQGHAYRDMTTDEIRRFYGVDTLEDAKKLIEGKTEDEILDHIANRIDSEKTPEVAQKS